MVHINSLPVVLTGEKLPRFTAPLSFASRKELTRYHKLQPSSLMPLAFLLIGVLMSFTAIAPVSAQYYTDINGIRQCPINPKNFDPKFDYFAQEGKVGPNFSQYWSVTYHKSYKRIVVWTNKEKSGTKDSVVIYAYLDGTPIPTDAEILAKHGDGPSNRLAIQKVEIPLRGVGLGSATMIPAVEFLGQRQNIKIIATDSKALSPCIQKLVKLGRTQDDTVYPFDETDFAKAKEKYPNLDGIFFGVATPAEYTTVLAQVKSVHSKIGVLPFQARFESNVKAQVEWVEYMSLFFNREHAAENITGNIKLRLDCSSEIALNQNPPPAKKPKVLVTSFAFNSYDDLVCPHWQCELIEKAGGEVVEFPFPKYPWDDQNAFIAFAKDADIWIYTNANWDEQSYYGATPYSTAFPNVVNKIKAFNDGNVFDIRKQPYLAWFESLQAEPDQLLRDFVNIFYPGLIQHKNVYLRNVFTETASKQLFDANECADLNQPKFNFWQTTGCALTEDTDIVKIPGLDQVPFCPTLSPTAPTTKIPTKPTSKPTKATNSPVPKPTAHICVAQCKKHKKRPNCVGDPNCKCKFQSGRKRCFAVAND